MLVSPTGGKQFQRTESTNSETNTNIIQVLINKTGVGLMGIYKPEKYPQSHVSCCPALESPIPTYWKTLTQGKALLLHQPYSMSPLLCPLHSSTPTAPTCHIFFFNIYWKIFPKNGKISKVPGEQTGEILLNHKSEEFQAQGCSGERYRVKGNRKKTGVHSDGPEMTSVSLRS